MVWVGGKDAEELPMVSSDGGDPANLVVLVVAMAADGTVIFPSE